MPKEQEPIYRIHFVQENKSYEIYAKFISEESLMGFMEVDELLFSDEATVVVDPSEEKLKDEFKGVKSIFIPYHAVNRIDVMYKEGPARVRNVDESKSNVSHFPGKFNKDQDK